MIGALLRARAAEIARAGLHGDAEAILTVAPREVETLLLLGRVRAHAGRWPEAEAILVEALALSPADVSCKAALSAVRAMRSRPAWRRVSGAFVALLTFAVVPIAGAGLGARALVSRMGAVERPPASPV